MIHFDFTVSDVDAQYITNIIRQQITSNNRMILGLIGKPNTDRLIDGLRDDNIYIEDLILKMKNTKADE